MLNKVARLIVEVVTEQQLEEQLALKRGTMRRMRREGRGPKWFRCGRLVRYDRRKVLEWLEANEGGK